MAAPLCVLGCSSNSSGSGATGGASAHGGATGSGGASATGGANSTGGTVAHGGSIGSGGTVASGGSNISGGSIASGGSISSGGTVASGGSISGGGSSGHGGTTSTSGTSACKFSSSTVTAAIYPNGLTLTKACSPYLVDEINVNDGGVLTIEAGTTLKFSDNTTISVGQSGTGKVLINGTAQSKVTLTTQYSPPVLAGWYGLVFYSGTASGSKVSYTTVDYAGGNGDGSIVIDSALPDGTLTLDHLAIDHVDTPDFAIPIYMGDGSTTIACTNCTSDGKPLP
jgi:hypothetical protein